MDLPAKPYAIFSLGDSALTIDLGNKIEASTNREVLARFEQLQKNPLAGMTEAVPAYCSLTIYYNVNEIKKWAPPTLTAFDWMKKQAEEWMQQPLPAGDRKERKIRIPVCYKDEFAPDLDEAARLKNITAEELVKIHSGKSYRVYMLGFLPGFPYMGEVVEEIALPRKPHPVPVPGGSVGIAGRQTGIYPFASPGGWQIIGRTPLALFEPERTVPTLLKAGDEVEFFPISKDEFFQMKKNPSITGS